MFINPIRAIRVLRNALLVVAPLLLLLMSLGVLTELRAHDISWDAFWSAPLRVLEFWPQIARDMVPGLAAMFMAYLLAARFVRDLYGLRKLKQGFQFLWRWRFGPLSFGPYLLIKEGDIDKGEDKVLTRLGGPGNLVIYNDSAVVLERAGQITRVERSSFVPLEAFEKVYRVVDLRPKRKPCRVEAMTREGIPVTCEADISYRIRGGDQEPSERLPYPMLGREVLKAATCTWKCESRFSEDGELDWEELIILAHTDGILRSILARYQLNQLIGPLGWEEDEPHPRRAIREELERELKKEARQLGVEILSVNLGDIKVEDEITQQWIVAWKAEWERQCLERRAEGEAEYAFQMETAKAQAQAEMVLELMQALRSLVVDTSTLSARLHLMRVIAMLRRASLDPWTQMFLPARATRALAALQDMIAGIGLGGQQE